MYPLTSALAKSRPQFDARPQACVHPSVLPPPVAPPLVCAAPPPPAARAGWLAGFSFSSSIRPAGC